MKRVAIDPKTAQVAECDGVKTVFVRSELSLQLMLFELSRFTDFRNLFTDVKLERLYNQLLDYLVEKVGSVGDIVDEYVVTVCTL